MKKAVDIIQKYAYKKFLKAKKIGIDTETTGLNPWTGDMPFGISFFTEDGDALYFEWPVDPFTRMVKPDIQELQFCKDILENPNITKVFFHAKFDIRMMEVAYDIYTVAPIEEVMFMALMQYFSQSLFFGSNVLGSQ